MTISDLGVINNENNMIYRIIVQRDVLVGDVKLKCPLTETIKEVFKILLRAQCSNEVNKYILQF